MRIVILTILVLYSMCCVAQSGLHIYDGAHLKLMNTIAVTVDSDAGNITLDSNAVLSADASSIYLDGDWMNKGDFQSCFGTVYFKGNSTQLIDNDNASFYNFTVNNSAGVTLENSTQLRNELVFENGILTTEDYDTLYLGTTGRFVNERSLNNLVGHVQTTTSSKKLLVSIGVDLLTSESLGDITVLRSSGLGIENSTYAINSINNTESIDCIWSIKTAFLPQQPVLYSLSWFSEFDNNVVLKDAQIWYNRNPWDTLGYAIDASARTVKFSTTETGQFTVGKSFQSQFIPTGFTPDGDGTNDQWEIPLLKNYPNARTLVYDRAGQQVFSATGANFWNGTYKGKNAPTGAYYFVIELGDGTEPRKGNVNIIRLSE